jgi:TolA-binding protein
VPADDLYRTGTAKFRAGELDAAVLVFYELILNHPMHPLRERAQFQVADIVYAQKDFRAALIEFEGLAAAVPNGAKTPDTLLKIGLCHRELGDETRARAAWERVTREYPGSAAARQAQTLLRSSRSG